MNGETIHIDPQLLFQRLAAAADKMYYDNQADVFKYELCSFPSSLFESSGMFSPADKPVLANAIWSLSDCSIQEQISYSVKYVIDGGLLLQRLPWTYGETFGGILVRITLTMSKENIVRPQLCLMVTQTKDCAHQKHSRGLASTHVQFNKSTPFRSKKDHTS